MTSQTSFDQNLRTWLSAEAEHQPVPDHLGEVLVRTAATNQRAWWSSPERWLPVATTTSLGSRTPAARAILVLALVGILTVALLGSAILTGRIRFGPATPIPVSNGRLFVADGSQLLSYAADGTDRQVVRSLDATATDLRFSPDGRRLAYILQPPANRIEIVDVGSGEVVSIPVAGMTGIGGPIGWSPDGRQLLFVSTDDVEEYVGLAATDGSGARIIDTASISPSGRWGVGWSPQGDRIAFAVGEPSAEVGSEVGTIYIARPDGSDMRALLPSTPIFASSGSWSPDPSVARILFTREGNQVQFADVDTGKVTPVAGAFWPTWSPTGDRIATWQADVFRTDDALAGTPRPVPLVKQWSAGSCDDHPDFKDRGFCGPTAWSPDGKRVYAPDITGTSILSVLADGSGQPIVIPRGTPSEDSGQVAWQPVD